MADERPVLNQLNLVVREFDESLAFYRRLGLDLAERGRPDFRQRHAEIVLANGFVLEFDDEPLARLYNAGWRRPGGGSRALIGFSVPTREAVDRRYAELLAAGYAGRQPPYDTFWGARYAVVADPDGNEVGLMSPLDERRRSWPPIASPDA
jgi:catechol 2,3-dioxygenase-like lactoylglutathione lyase family enzyme